MPQINIRELPELQQKVANYGTSKQADPALSAAGDVWLIAAIYVYENK